MLEAANGLRLLVMFVGFRKLEKGDCAFVDDFELNKLEKGVTPFFAEDTVELVGLDSD